LTPENADQRSDLTRAGNAFQALAAVTGKARSPECGTSRRHNSSPHKEA